MILKTAQQLYAEFEQMDYLKWWMLNDRSKVFYNTMAEAISYRDAALGVFKYTNPFYAAWWVIKELVGIIWTLVTGLIALAFKIGIGVLLGHLI